MSQNKGPNPHFHSFAINVRNLRKEMHLTQTQLGQILGVTKTCISNYEKGVSIPETKRLVDMADFFNVEIGQLLGYTPDMSLHDSGDCQRRVSIVNTVVYHQDPLLPENIIDEFVLPSINLKSGNYFGIIVPDNAMNRSHIKKGDVAVIRRQTPSSGDIVLFVTEGGKPMLRKVFIHQDGLIVLLPDSDDSTYPPINLNPKTDKYEIFGKVSQINLTF